MDLTNDYPRFRLEQPNIAGQKQKASQLRPYKKKNFFSELQLTKEFTNF